MKTDIVDLCSHMGKQKKKDPAKNHPFFGMVKRRKGGIKEEMSALRGMRYKICKTNRDAL